MLSAQAEAQGKRLPGLYVIAVRGDCVGNQPFALINGRMILTGGAAEGRSAEKLSLLTRFIDDPPAREEAVEELKKNRAVRLVERIEEADLVFHVCSSYWEDIMGPGARISINGTNITPSYRVAARALLFAPANYEAGAEAYPRLMQEALWKADTLNDKEAKSQRDRRDRRVRRMDGQIAGIMISSGEGWRREVSPAELAKRFERESKDLVKRLGALPARAPGGGEQGAEARAGRGSLVDATTESRPDVRPEARPEARVEEVGTVKIETALVVVPVSVLDRDGKYIPDLKREQFEIYEDGIKQEISDFGSTETPFHVVLLLDMSGSTRFRVEEIQQAALAFVDQLQPQDQVMVVSFESAVRVAAEFTSDREQLTSAILRTRTGGATRVYDALDLVLTERFNRIKGRKAIVVFSDGVDTASKLAEKEDVIGHVEESGTLVYSIRYDTLADVKARIQPGAQVPHPRRRGTIADPEEVYAEASTFLGNLARSSGGRFFDVDTIDDIQKAFSGIAEELRRQYWLGYYPATDDRDGRYRKIRVRVDREDVAVRAREGYRAQELKR